MKAFFIILFFVGLVVSFYSCNDNIISNPDQLVFPDSSVSYQNHVQPFLSFYCAFAGCHGDGDRRPMTNYFGLFDTYNLGLVIAYKPDNSVLIQLIENRLKHPYEYYWTFKDNHIKGMRKWVLEGAQNN